MNADVDQLLPSRGDLFLLQTARRMEPKAAQTLFQRLIRAANDQMYETVMNAPQNPREQALYEAARRVSLGLEAETGGDLTEAVQTAEQTPIETLARRGAALLNALRRQAEQTERETEIETPSGTASILDPTERYCLERMRQTEIAFRTPPPDLQLLPHPAPVQSLQSLRLADRALRRFQARKPLFEALPMHLLQSGEEPTETLDRLLAENAPQTEPERREWIREMVQSLNLPPNLQKNAQRYLLRRCAAARL